MKGLNITTAWMLPVQGITVRETRVDFNGFFNGSGDFRKIAQNAIDWMNKFVPPHQLTNVSMLQMEMENSQDVLISICHTAGENPEEIIPVGTDSVYSVEFFTGKDSDAWKSLYGKAIGHINDKGANDYGFKLFATNFNISEDEFKVVGVISWHKLVESNIRDNRDANCCCNIF